MNESCETVRRALEDGQGGSAPELVAHLQACARCVAHSRVLATLGCGAAVGGDERQVQRVLMALPRAPWQRRRLSTWFPLAAALVLVGSGLSMLGGVPAQSVVLGIPSMVGSLGGWLAGRALDMLTVAEGGRDALRALSAVAGAWVAGWLVMVALGSGWAAVMLARRREVGD